MMDKPIFDATDPVEDVLDFAAEMNESLDYIEFGIDTVSGYIETKIYFDEMLNDGNYLNDLQAYENRILAYYNEQYSLNETAVTDGILNNLSAREMEQLTIPLTNAVVYPPHNDVVIAYYDEFRGDRTNAEVYNDLRAYLLPLQQGISRILAQAAGQVFTDGTEAYDDLVAWSEQFKADMITAISADIDLGAKLTDAHNVDDALAVKLSDGQTLLDALIENVNSATILNDSFAQNIDDATTVRDLLTATISIANDTEDSLQDAINNGDLVNYVKKADIVDDLVTGDATRTLSANQGKILQDNKVDNGRVLTDVPINALFTDENFNAIEKPTIISPADGTINYIGEITASEFATDVDKFIGDITQIEWQSSFVADFSDIFETHIDSIDFTKWTPSIISGLTTVYVRVRHISGAIVSKWSDVISFTTPDIYIETPTVTVEGYPDSVKETPTITTSEFIVHNADDTHYATSWEVVDVEAGSVVFGSPTDTENLLSIKLPYGVLDEGKEYDFKAKHIAETYGASGYGVIRATTLDAFHLKGLEIAKIYASDADAGDFFGTVTCISDDKNIILSTSRGDNGDTSDAYSGSAYILEYDVDNDVYTETQKLTPTNQQASEQFGASACMCADGKTIFIGSPLYDIDSDNTSSGRGHIYEKVDDDWIETLIVPSDNVAGDRFGNFCAMSKDGLTLFVAASYKLNSDTNQGCVYIYKKVDGDWVEDSVLIGDTVDDGVSDFGTTLAVDDATNTLVIGTKFSYVYIFNNIDDVFTQGINLYDPDDQSGSDYGETVTISGDGNVIIVGANAYDIDSDNTYVGKVYVYTKTDTTYTDIQLVASDWKTSMRFGQALSSNSDGSTILIGSPYYNIDSDNLYAGAIYQYNYNGYGYDEVKITPSDWRDEQRFGGSCDITSDGLMAVIGSYTDDSGDTDAGSLYIYK